MQAQQRNVQQRKRQQINFRGRVREQKGSKNGNKRQQNGSKKATHGNKKTATNSKNPKNKKKPQKEAKVTTSNRKLYQQPQSHPKARAQTTPNKNQPKHNQNIDTWAQRQKN